MLTLVVYVSIALGFSFLCSVAEAVLLSVSTAHVRMLERQGKPAGVRLRILKEDINKPLAAILTLNTVAHTVGAAGAGAQAAVVFGSAYVGLASAILTLLILVLSEIIPKTLGAVYWRRLAPLTAWCLQGLTLLMYPFVLLAEGLTARLSQAPTLRGFSRAEFAAMAELGTEEGELAEHESRILTNLFRLRETTVKAVMTPRPVVFSLPEHLSVAEYFTAHGSVRFSRIPIYREDREHISGFVLRADLLLAQARGNTGNTLGTYRRELQALPDSASLLHAFDGLVSNRANIVIVVNEYGDLEGVVTLEDVLETLLGLEIIDESDTVADMQQLARRLWRRRARDMGLQVTDSDE